MPRPLVQHPHALADGEPDARPMLGGALEDAPRFVFDQQVGGRPSARLVLEIKIAERPPVLVERTGKTGGYTAC